MKNDSVTVAEVSFAPDLLFLTRLDQLHQIVDAVVHGVDGVGRFRPPLFRIYNILDWYRIL